MALVPGRLFAIVAFLLASVGQCTLEYGRHVRHHHGRKSKKHRSQLHRQHGICEDRKTMMNIPSISEGALRAQLANGLPSFEERLMSFKRLDIKPDLHEHSSEEFTPLYFSRWRSRMPECPPDALRALGDQTWYLLIDGKDADSGMMAYDGQGSGSLGLKGKNPDYAAHGKQGYAWEAEHLKDELSLDHIREMHNQITNFSGSFSHFRGVSDNCKEALSDKSIARIPSGDIRPILRDIDPRVMAHVVTKTRMLSQRKHAIARMSAPTILVETLLEEYIQRYVQVIDELETGDSSAEEVQQAKFQAIANFVYDVALLHPFPDGNGRTRTMLLQRELTRHGFHPVIMYDNNREIVTSTKEEFYQAVLEGLRFWEIAMGSPEKGHPWVGHEKDHLEHVSEKKHDVGAFFQVLFAGQ